MIHFICRFGNRFLNQKWICLFATLLLLSLIVGACSEQDVTAISTKPPILAATATATLALILNPTPTISASPSTLITTITTVSSNSTPVLSVTPKLSMPQDWQYRWLKGIPCRPPCFEGITPGITMATDAVKILQQDSLVSSARISPPSGGTYNYVVWNWLDTSIGLAGTGGNLFYDSNSPNQIIYLIWPFFSTKFKLGDIIQAYGEPSHVVAGFEINPEKASLYYYVYIVYLDQGVIIANPEYSYDIPIMNNNLIIDDIKFFVPNITGLEKVKPSRLNKNLLVPWQGFKDYRFYCRHANGPQHIVEDCSKVPGIGKP